MAPSVYIIAGPNGAGKTPFAKEFLPNYADCKNFVNADLIAQGISPLSPDAAAFRAGRLVLEQIDFYVKRGESFGFETTLSGRTYLRMLDNIKKHGYEISIFFLWVSEVGIVLNRIERRVARGGHDVPKEFVIRRFDRSMRNFLDVYRLRNTSFVGCFD